MRSRAARRPMATTRRSEMDKELRRLGALIAAVILVAG